MAFDGAGKMLNANALACTELHEPVAREEKQSRPELTHEPMEPEILHRRLAGYDQDCKQLNRQVSKLTGMPESHGDGSPA